MKWEEKRYTPQELQRMQQEAVERVRQMQRRSEQAIRHSPRAPSFFVQDSPQQQEQQRQPELPPQEPVQQPQPAPSPAPQPEPRPQQQHSSQGQPSANMPALPAPGQGGFSLDQVLDSLHLDHDRLLILALFFLLAGERSDNGLMLALLYLFL